MRYKIISIFALLTIPLIAFAYPFKKEVCDLGWEHVHHDHSEASYQQAWCSLQNGIEEYENKDFTRVDCLSEKYADELDFANKWQESIGQALHYGLMTGKKPRVVLILDNPKTQMVYFKRVQRIAKEYNFDAVYITDAILNLDKDGKCLNPKCKCHRYKLANTP